MRVAARQDRDAYLRTQVARSDAKFDYCKVALADVLRYRARLPDATGPVLCLGTRNGREVDLFRIAFFWPHLLHPLLLRHPTLGRSQWERLGPRSGVGVEINPRGGRQDVWVGSFDAMPSAWGRRFGVAFSNSFDQSLDPVATASEWRRVMRPGGVMILCYAPGAAPTESDPVGDLTDADLLALFDPCRLLWAGRSACGYRELGLSV